MPTLASWKMAVNSRESRDCWPTRLHDGPTLNRLIPTTPSNRSFSSLTITATLPLSECTAAGRCAGVSWFAQRVGHTLGSRASRTTSRRQSARMTDKDEVRGSNPRAPTRKAFRSNELRRAFFVGRTLENHGVAPGLREETFSDLLLQADRNGTKKPDGPNPAGHGWLRLLVQRQGDLWLLGW